MASTICYQCNEPVKKDVFALNKKAIGTNTNRILCLTCLAEYLDCTENDLKELIQQYKMNGCVLFI